MQKVEEHGSNSQFAFVLIHEVTPEIDLEDDKSELDRLSIDDKGNVW